MPGSHLGGLPPGRRGRRLGPALDLLDHAGYQPPAQLGGPVPRSRRSEKGVTLRSIETRIAAGP